MFENDDDYKKIFKQLKYNFQNKKLLEQALVRKSACSDFLIYEISYISEDKRNYDNEKLELCILRALSDGIV